MDFYKEEQILVDSLPMAACVLAGPDHILVAANQSLLLLLQKSGSSIGRPIGAIFPELINQDIYRHLEETIQFPEQSFSGESHLSINKNVNGPLYLKYFLKARINTKGDPYAVLATAVDISQHLVNEKKLLQAEQRQAFLLELSDTLRPLANPAEIQKEAARILGEYLNTSRVGYGDVDRQEQRWFRTDHNWTDGTVDHHHGVHDLAEFGPEVLEALRTGKNLVVNDMLEDARTAAPEMQAAFAALQFRAALTVSLIKDDCFVAAMYVHNKEPRNWTQEEIDLTYEVAERTWAAVQRAQAEKTLRDSEDKFRTLFNTIDEGFCILEVLYDDLNNPVDLLYLLTNEAFENLTGVKSAEGKTLKGIASGAEQFWIDSYSNVAETGKAIRFENYSKVFHKWFNVYASKVGGPSSRQVALVFDDITERKQQEQLKNDFISMVSHELKTPLTTLKAHLQLTERKATQLKDQQIEASVRKSLLQVERMKKLIQGFLDVSRLEEGKIYLNLTEFDLSQLITESLEDFYLLDNTHQLIFKPMGEFQIRGDRDKLGQVINNLLSNAVKYSPKDSKVTITSELNGPAVKVIVRDEGIGIKPQNLDKIFNRFYRVEDKQVEHVSGFGIGLYLCAEIVKYHKGEIGVDSLEGKGSTFWFKLPLLENL
ncbi:ATP-binding protein [Desertivirga arenae]|uniref:ATP-binding protein n=1 Tax=Desertivirga arenae TaxID=2810309 RepID=UPI001A96E7FC|nr:ATP-binding protein [Pedobacter sp. SYSU D00823]